MWRCPAGVETIDGRGRWVTPGLFSALTDLGLWDVEEVDESNDTEAGDSPFGAALDVTPAINPRSQHVAVSRAGGVTRASVAGVPGGTIFAGQGALIDLGADMDAVMRPRAFQVVTLAERGGAIAGGQPGRRARAVPQRAARGRELRRARGADRRHTGAPGRHRRRHAGRSQADRSAAERERGRARQRRAADPVRRRGADPRW
jgi:hypothetical protein